MVLPAVKCHTIKKIAANGIGIYEYVGIINSNGKVNNNNPWAIIPIIPCLLEKIWDLIIKIANNNPAKAKQKWLQFANIPYGYGSGW